LLGNDSVKQEWKRSDGCYAMTQYAHVNNGGEDVFCGQCGGYITSMKPVPQNRVTNSNDNNTVNKVATGKAVTSLGNT
jgi:hypothetical protein